MMRVMEIGGQHVAHSPEDLERLFDIRSGAEGNSFTLCPDDAEFPQLNVLARGGLATLNYLPEAEGPGLISWGNSPDSKPDQTYFFSLSRNEADNVEISQRAVLPFSTAVAAAQEFFASGSLPACLTWMEL